MTQRTIPCPECQGSGTEEHEELSDAGVYVCYTEDCKNCAGTGHIVPLFDPEDYGDWLYHKRKDEEDNHG